jgi:lysophospholipase L1-like esterase
VLFQGDSITETGRRSEALAPNQPEALGSGYALLVAAALLRAHPEADLRIFNRGVSGNRLPELEARWQKDTLDLSPDILSILIGVNDYWHTLSHGYPGTAQSYERGYTGLLERTRRALPEVRLVVLEPFVLHCGVVTDAWFPAFDAYRTAARRVAAGAGASFIELQSVFDRSSSDAPATYWAADGVHPTAAGHAVIADAWLAAVNPVTH